MDALTSDAQRAYETNRALFRVMESVNDQAFKLFGNKVRTGPFAGMTIPQWTPWDDSNESTKLLGSYEHELHGAIDYARWRRPQVIANIGCAEGYYAVGLARLIPAAQVFAFDIDVDARFLCAKYAMENEAFNVSVREGVQNVDEIGELPLGRRLYVVDVEGAELELVPSLPRLVYSDLIVECHDFIKPETGSMLAERLSATHRVELIAPSLPDFKRFEFISQNPTVMAVLMVLEKRPMPSCWLACWANRRG